MTARNRQGSHRFSFTLDIRADRRGVYEALSQPEDALRWRPGLGKLDPPRPAFHPGSFHREYYRSTSLDLLWNIVKVLEADHERCIRLRRHWLTFFSTLEISFGRIGEDYTRVEVQGEVEPGEVADSDHRSAIREKVAAFEWEGMKGLKRYLEHGFPPERLRARGNALQ